MKRIALLMMLFFGASAFCQETGKASSLFADKYDWYGISIKAPEGYSAKEVNVAWNANKEFTHSYAQFFDVAATSGDGQCMILYAKNLGRLIKRGIEESVDGQMGRINREVLQAKGLLDENCKFKRNRPSDFLPERFITKVSGKAAQNGFGANVLCLYTLETDGTVFKDQSNKDFNVSANEYPCIVRLFILKEGGANYDVLLLLSKEAMKKKERYIGDLYGNITFDADKIEKTWEVINVIN